MPVTGESGLQAENQQLQRPWGSEVPGLFSEQGEVQNG